MPSGEFKLGEVAGELAGVKMSVGDVKEDQRDLRAKVEELTGVSKSIDAKLDLVLESQTRLEGRVTVVQSDLEGSKKDIKTLQDKTGTTAKRKAPSALQKPIGILLGEWLMLALNKLIPALIIAGIVVAFMAAQKTVQL